MKLYNRFNTASGKHCCNAESMGGFKFMYKGCVSIPQAVSTVATDSILLLRNKAGKVSIPQAVSTVATYHDTGFKNIIATSFNTASGKHCCNASGAVFCWDDYRFQYRKR